MCICAKCGRISNSFEPGEITLGVYVHFKKAPLTCRMPASAKMLILNQSNISPTFSSFSCFFLDAYLREA